MFIILTSDTKLVKWKRSMERTVKYFSVKVPTERPKLIVHTRGGPKNETRMLNRVQIMQRIDCCEKTWTGSSLKLEKSQLSILFLRFACSKGQEWRHDLLTAKDVNYSLDCPFFHVELEN